MKTSAAILSFKRDTFQVVGKTTLSMHNCQFCHVENERALYEEEAFIVVQCGDCQCPLIILREHTTVPSLDVRERIEKKAEEIQAQLGEDYVIDRTLFENREHLHYHVRKI